MYLWQIWKKHFSREMYIQIMCCLLGSVAIVYYYIR